jgi:hypothetical protein
MSLRSYLIGMFFSTLLCFGAWVLVLFNIDPYSTNFAGLGLFYLSLFFALVGVFTLLGFYLRVWFSKNEVIFSHVGPAFRQGVLLALILVGCLVLQSFRVLSLWSGGLFTGAVVLLEFFFMTR